jgi:hypothetical protein
LAVIISNEQESLVQQLSNWEKLIEKKPSINEIVEFTQLDNLIEQMVHRRLYRKEEDIIEYAAKASELV